MTPLEVLVRALGSEQAARAALDALRGAGFEVTRNVELYAAGRTWQQDH